MKKSAGLTLVEMLIVVSLLAILLGLGTIVFSGFARKDQIESTAQEIVAVLGEAQAKTLAGYSQGQESGLNFGIHFQTDAYIFFSGTSFDPQDQTNQKFTLPVRLEISTIFFPSGNVIFEKITGQVRDFNPGQNLIILTDQAGNQEKRISINKLGVVKIE